MSPVIQLFYTLGCDLTQVPTNCYEAIVLAMKFIAYVVLIYYFLFVCLLIFSYIVSALIGVTMFVVDILRFGKPHSKFDRISSIESYNQRLEEIESKESELAADNISDPIDIDL